MIEILRFIAGFFALTMLVGACSIGGDNDDRTASTVVENGLAEEFVDWQEAVDYAGELQQSRIEDYAVAVYVNEIARIEAEKLAAEQAAAAAQQVVSAPVYSSGGGGNLASIRACESGGNYSTNTGNGYYGAYQFDQQTWNSVGGTGNPADASPATQDAMANALIAQRGTSPWPNCG